MDTRIPKPRFQKYGMGYAVKVGNVLIGYVWRTTSGRVWGSLSCTPRLPVWAWSRPGRDAEGSAGTRQRAVEQLQAARRRGEG